MRLIDAIEGEFETYSFYQKHESTWVMSKLTFDLLIYLARPDRGNGFMAGSNRMYEVFKHFCLDDV